MSTLTPSDHKNIHYGLAVIGVVFPIGLAFLLLLVGFDDNVGDWAKMTAGGVAAFVALFGAIAEYSDPPAATDLEKPRQRVAYLRDLMTSITLPALLSVILFIDEDSKFTSTAVAVVAIATLVASIWAYRVLDEL